MVDETKLKVFEAFQEEAYKGIIRIDSETMHKLKVRPGDVIEIEGGRKTVGIVDRAYPSDVGQAIIRMDGIIRRNAKTGIGSYVEVRKAEIKEALSIKIAPGQEGVIVEASPEVFKRGLMGRALVKGDIISLGGTKRRRMTMKDSPIENIFDMFNDLGGDFVAGGFGFRGLKFVVAETTPKQAVIITENTNIIVSPKAMKVLEEKVPEVTYEDVGGLGEELKKIREMIELPLKHPEIFERLGIESPKGILLHGPPGCGKTLLAKAVANESEANFISINGPEIMSKFIGEAEKRIRDIFEEAEKNAPSIIFIDEIDAIAPKREESYGEVERRVVAQMLGSMDGMKERGKVIIIAATNRPNAVDPALRRPGRFDREIEIGVPSQEARLEILKIHTRNMPLTKGLSLDKIAERTYGFVGADLSALCKETAMIVLRGLVPNMELDDKELPKDLLDKLVITQKDFSEALKIIRPSAMREVLVEVPKIKWEDIGGLETTKQELKEAVEWPLKFPDMFKRMGIRAPKGILLHGPPGCGKTLLAKAVANESEANFISIKGPEIMSKWVGESLPYDEELIVKKDGIIKRMKIGDIVENKEKVEVLSFDKDKRVNFTEVDDYIKHQQTSQLVEVTTRTGRKIRVTKDHSLFSFISGKLVSAPTSHLIPNESFIAIPKRLNLPKEIIKSINLYGPFKEDKSIFICNVKDYLIKCKLILGLDKTAEILETSKGYLSQIISRNLPICVTKFDKSIKKAGLALDFDNLKIKLKGSTHSYPIIFGIDKDFWRMVGLWVAEGDFNGYTVRIHNSNPEIRKDAKNICEKYRFETTESERCFSINSLLVQKIFRNVLGLITHAENKKIPAILFGLDRESKSNFLKGYFSGDGSIYASERGKFMIEAGTVSENLANDLLYILLDFGIVATIYKKKERTGSITNRLSILGVKNFEIFKEIGFIDNKRNERIGKYIESRKWFRSELIPLSGELYELTSQNVNVGSAIGKERLKGVLMYVDRDKSKYKEYWDLVEGDIFFDLVKEIKPIKNEEFVYDVSVPYGQNFVAGFGGIFAHNSEKGIKKIFERARHVSPVIIFFDEIDAIAPRRGRDISSNVTDRVINQLLTEMDGVEELNDVVIIGATNRPDIIDPAILRAGRFDRILLVPVPDKVSRLETLKVHTKGMPIAKDVNLNKLAEQTENFVGSDIENLCREAALLTLREDKDAKEVNMEYFKKALKKVGASINEEDMTLYKSMEKEFLKKSEPVKEVTPSYLG